MKGYKHLTQLQKQTIEKYFAETPIVPAVAQRLGINPQRVRAHLKKRGFQLTRKRFSACERNKELVIEMARSGHCCTEIGRVIGAHDDAVKELLIRHNIPFENHQCLPGDRNHHWKGGRQIDKNGYVLVLATDHPFRNRHGYVREHRLVMEKHIGRYLDRKEVVHHKDGNKQNNAIENLEVFAKNGLHLKHELAGHCPKWSPEGKERIQSAARQREAKKRMQNPAQKSAPDAAVSL